MKLRINEKILKLSGYISEFWLLDLVIPKKIDLSNYINIQDVDSFTDIINYWTNDESISEVNRKSILRFIESIPELKDNLEFCNPEIIYYEFGGIIIDELKVDISCIKFIDDRYEIKLKSNGYLYFSEKENVEQIRELLNDSYDEEEEEYLEDSIDLGDLTYGDFPIFQTIEDEKRMNDFIYSTLDKIRMLHYPDV